MSVATLAPSQLTIRTATREDLPQVVAMALHFLASTPYGELLGSRPAGLEALIAQVLTMGVIFLAEVPDVARSASADCTRIVGMLAAVVVPHPLSGELCAEELAWWVEPEWRRSTIGPRLLSRAEWWAQTQGARLMKMVAPIDAPEVGAFYVKRGYLPVETAYQKSLLHAEAR